MGTRLSYLRLLLASLVPAVAFVATSPAGPNADGVLLLHANRSLVYTVDTQDYCGQSDLSACSLAVATVPWEPDTTRVFYVLAAFPATSQPRLKALSFGVDWDPDKLVVLGHGSCGDFEIADNSWPDPGTGTGLSWSQVQTGLLVDVCWFAAYTYSANDPDTTSFAVTPHPIQEAVMVDDATPPNEDVVAAFGRLGFGTAGSAPCPAGGDSGGDSPGGGDGPVGGGDEPGNPGGDSPEISMAHCASRSVLIRFAPNEVSFPQETPSLHEFFIRSLDDAEFSRSNLRSVLEDVGVETFETVAPEWRHLTEEEEVDIHGRRIDLVDFTNVYRLALDGTSTAAQVIGQIRGEPGVEYVECDPLVFDFAVPDSANDPAYPCQWYLWPAPGLQSCYTDTCDVGFDIGAPLAWSLQDSAGTKIGISDSQVNAGMPGLSEHYDHELSRSFVPNQPDWLFPQPGTKHGTKVASIAAAGTDDTLNIASPANLPKNRNDSVIVVLYVNEPSYPDSQMNRGARALSYVVQDLRGRVRVVNHSWGGPSCKLGYQTGTGYSSTARDAFRNAFMADINLVCASGNSFRPPGNCSPSCTEPDTCFAFPAAFADYTLAVAAVDCHGHASPDFKQGGYIDLAAPGRLIAHVTSDGWSADLDFWTSYSAPLASATIALMLGANPDLTNEDCHSILRLTALPLDEPRERVGAGLLQAGEAVRLCLPPYFLVHDSTFTYDVVDEGSWPATFVNVDGVTADPEVSRPVLIHAYRLIWDVIIPIPDSAAVARVWPRGKTSSGWRRIDETTDYWYDGLFYANHADMEWHGGQQVSFTNYTYEVFSSDGDTLIGWFPFDPDDPGTPPPKLTFSYLLDGNSAGVDDPKAAAAAKPMAVRTWNQGSSVIFEVTTREASVASIALYDVGGRELRVLREEAEPTAGLHRIRWDQRDGRGSKVPSGVYLARVWPGAERGRGPSAVTRVVIVR
jgi:subtilisin family serine protease